MPFRFCVCFPRHAADDRDVADVTGEQALAVVVAVQQGDRIMAWLLAIQEVLYNCIGLVSDGRVPASHVGRIQAVNPRHLSVGSSQETLCDPLFLLSGIPLGHLLHEPQPFSKCFLSLGGRLFFTVHEEVSVEFLETDGLEDALCVVSIQVVVEAMLVVALMKLLHLLNEAGTDHVVHTGVQPLVQNVLVALQPEYAGVPIAQRSAEGAAPFQLLLLGDDLAVGLLVHLEDLQAPFNLSAILRVKSQSPLRIHQFEALVQLVCCDILEASTVWDTGEQRIRSVCGFMAGSPLGLQEGTDHLP